MFRPRGKRAMMEVKATAATPMAMTTSVRLNAAGRRREIRGLRGEGVKGVVWRLWMLIFSPRLRDALTRGCWIVERCESMKV
jgi:hypothetical protein